MRDCLDFAECPLGHSTPIRPSMLYREIEGPELSYDDVPFEVVACIECKRVYKFETERLKALATDYGLSPWSPEAPMHVFRVQLRCGETGCDTPVSVIAVRKRDTTAEELQKETTEWTWENLTCPSGYPIPKPRQAK